MRPAYPLDQHLSVAGSVAQMDYDYDRFSYHSWIYNNAGACLGVEAGALV